MNEYHWLSEKMPAVALGTAAWGPDEAHHLGTCGSCQDEWDLVYRSSRMGRETALRLEAGSTSQAVLQRLERARSKRLRRGRWSFAGLAADSTLDELEGFLDSSEG